MKGAWKIACVAVAGVSVELTREIDAVDRDDSVFLDDASVFRWTPFGVTRATNTRIVSRMLPVDLPS